MDWVQTLSIMVTVIGCAYYMHRDIMNDIKAQNARTDKLYEMYCDINQKLSDYRKESDQKLSDYRKESDQKFYDLLKESKK
jgi:hypothetical protein